LDRSRLLAVDFGAIFGAELLELSVERLVLTRAYPRWRFCGLVSIISFANRNHLKTLGQDRQLRVQLRVSERAMDEKRRKSPAISRLPPARSSYNKRATCEQWIKEGKSAIKWTRLSCRSFAANAVRLQLHALAYNLGNFLRTLATPEPIKDWSMTSLKEKLIKIGVKVVRHGRYIAFQMAEVAISRKIRQFSTLAWRRPVPSPSTARANGAGLPKTGKRGKLANDPAAIRRMSVKVSS
jgi:hypothetical protein